jgi:hypothetical protein
VVPKLYLGGTVMVPEEDGSVLPLKSNNGNTFPIAKKKKKSTLVYVLSFTLLDVIQ